MYVNSFHNRYLTHDPKEHKKLSADWCLLVDRSVNWDVNAVKGTLTRFEFCGFDANGIYLTHRPFP